VGLVAKALVRETRRLLSPSSSVIEQRYWYHGERVLDDGVLRNALLVIALYVIAFGAASLGGVAAGYPFLDAVFEAASVTGNVGLSIGVTAPSMPAFLKVLYIAVMWAGRLEFMAVLALAGFIGSLARRR
jgi:trk system potassium uptake protein TrkH